MNKHQEQRQNDMRMRVERLQKAMEGEYACYLRGVMKYSDQRGCMCYYYHMTCLPSFLYCGQVHQNMKFIRKNFKSFKIFHSYILFLFFSS